MTEEADMIEKTTIAEEQKDTGLCENRFLKKKIMNNVYQIGSGELTFDIIERIINENLKLELASEARERIQKCRDYLDKKDSQFRHTALWYYHRIRLAVQPQYLV